MASRAALRSVTSPGGPGVITVGAGLLAAAHPRLRHDPPLALRAALRMLDALVILVAAMLARYLPKRKPPILGISAHQNPSVNLLTVMLLLRNGNKGAVHGLIVLLLRHCDMLSTPSCNALSISGRLSDCRTK
jgi:hypothetical protein